MTLEKSHSLSAILLGNYPWIVAKLKIPFRIVERRDTAGPHLLVGRLKTPRLPNTLLLGRAPKGATKVNLLFSKCRHHRYPNASRIYPSKETVNRATAMARNECDTPFRGPETPVSGHST